MASKTAIQLVNEVGKNLRRRSNYTTLTDDDQAKFISQMVNLAKAEVEDLEFWDALRATITFPSVGGTHTYDTSSTSIVTSDPTVTNERSEVMRDPSTNQIQFWDVTDAGAYFRMRECTRDYAEDTERVDATDIAIPDLVAIYPFGDGLTVHFPFAPSGVRNYAFKVHNPQEDFTTAGTAILVPWRPVVARATFLCTIERGEEFGGDPGFWLDAYNKLIAGARTSALRNSAQFYAD